MTTESPSKGVRHPVHPDKISRYFSLQQCPLYPYQAYSERALSHLQDILLSPLFAQTGIQIELQQMRSIIDAGEFAVGPQAVSSDVCKYEAQKAWKQLYQHMMVREIVSPSPAKFIESGTSDTSSGRTVTVEVYSGFIDQMNRTN